MNRVAFLLLSVWLSIAPAAYHGLESRAFAGTISIPFPGPGIGGGKLSCTGGTITTAGGYQYNTFTSNGTLTCTGTGTADMLLCAGAGAGGPNTSNNSGGGGGGGDCETAASYALSSGSISVTIGAGGTASSNCSTGNGADSTLGAPLSVTAKGGGCGGTRTVTPTGGSVAQGWTGGSAGGAATIYSGTIAARSATDATGTG
jgi:hypothetical protein